MVVAQEGAPLLIEQCAVGLQAVVHHMPTSILLLQAQGLPVERQRAQQRLSAMPGEEHFALRLRVDILLGEPLEQLVGHHVAGHVGIVFRFLEIITIAARHVAPCTGRFEHHIEGTGKRRGSKFLPGIHPQSFSIRTVA